MFTMYEAFARERTQEQRTLAAQYRLTQQLSQARRWHRLAAFSARRAARSERRLTEELAADYQLVG
jgi:hypothetical protein